MTKPWLFEGSFSMWLFPSLADTWRAATAASFEVLKQRGGWSPAGCISGPPNSRFEVKAVTTAEQSRKAKGRAKA